MSLTAGTCLAHYEILEPLGKGAMGEVYLAEDTKLDRKVALKVLPPELAENEGRRARFQREAKALAALNHPNIITIHSVEEADGIHFITMELVKGKTLFDLIPEKGMSLEKFFEIAIPLANAVGAAHDAGIVHRDLKPGNVMVTEDGRVKVLDFGVAKSTGGFAGTDVDSDVPTAAKTEQGVIVGTCRYMSPEQIEGKPVDARSDVFSLGILLCEMATGTRPFDGDSAVRVMSSILKDTPPTVTELRAELPEALSQLVVPSARLREALGDYAPDIARLTPELQHRFPDLPEPAELPPEARRRYLFNGLLELLRNLSRDSPYGAAAGRSAVGGRCEPGARRARRVAPGEHAGRDRRHLS